MIDDGSDIASGVVEPGFTATMLQVGRGAARVVKLGREETQSSVDADI